MIRSPPILYTLCSRFALQLGTRKSRTEPSLRQSADRSPARCAPSAHSGCKSHDPLLQPS